MNLAEQIRNFLSDARERREQLQRQAAACQEEIEALYMAPLSREDALKFMLDYVDSRAAEYLQNSPHLRQVFRDAAYPNRYNDRISNAKSRQPLNLRDLDAGLRGTKSEHSAAFGDGLSFLGFTQEFFGGAGLFYFGDQVKAKIKEHFDALFPGYPRNLESEIGPPVEKRRKRIAELEKQIRKVEAEISDIDAQVREITSA